MKEFDLKKFNDEVFLAYSSTIVDPVKTRLIESGVFKADPELAQKLPDQKGGNYALKPFYGLLAGDAVIYDGSTDITDGSLGTYSQGIGAHGFAKSFTEKDFTVSIAGIDPMVQVAQQIAKYWSKHNQKVLLSTLKGIFASALAGSIVEKTGVGATDANDVAREVAGDNAEMFKVVFMHSVIASKLEKMQVLSYAINTNEKGIQVPTNIAYWNGRLVVVDDGCPVEEVLDEQEAVIGHKYTSYILGEGAFTYQPLPVKVPVEMERDAKKNGGETSLVSRERFVMAPEGVSLKATAYASKLALTLADIETASNWEIVNDGHGNNVAKKTIPFCALKTLIAE